MAKRDRPHELLVVNHPAIGEVFTFKIRGCGTRAQTVRRGIALAALVELIAADPRWGGLFEDWGSETGLVPAALEARQAVHAADHEAAAVAGQRIGELIEEKVDALAALANAFVADTLKWPPAEHLAGELVTRFLIFVAASAMGPLEGGRTAVEPSRQAPRVFLGEFRTRARETAESALARLDAHIANAKKARAAIAATAKRSKLGRRAARMPTAEGAKIRRNVEWMYRVDTGLATVSDLAREYHGGKPRDFVAGDDSKVVRAGIRTARQDLGMPAPGK